MSESAQAAAPTHCRGCGERLRGPYCSACGEAHFHTRLELRRVIEDLRTRFMKLDTRMLRTLGDLSVDPGQVGRNYLTGRRRAYVNPLEYALVAFVFAIAVNEGLLYLHGVPSQPLAARVAEFALRWGQLINFAILPLFALGLMKLFSGPPRFGIVGGGRQLRWIEHYVLVLFAFGHIALVQGLLAPLVPHLGVASVALFTVLPVLYLSWMFVGVCRTPWLSTIVRVSLAYIVGIQLLATVIAWLIAPELVAG